MSGNFDTLMPRLDEDPLYEAEAEQAHAWSISARLAALVLDAKTPAPAMLVGLVREARELHPAMAPNDSHDCSTP